VGLIVHGASPVILVPQTYWNVEQLSLKDNKISSNRQ
jgi:hypothetical protein